MIKQLKLSNFKGLSLHEEYGKLTLFSGPCGSGKSARLQAIQWAVTGTTSNDTGGNKPTSAAKWMKGWDMMVHVWADGMDVMRSLRTDSEGAVSHTVEVRVGNRVAFGREAEFLIGETLGRFLPMWRLNEFTALSPELRRQMILRLCSEAGGQPKTGDLVEQIVREAKAGEDAAWLRRKLEAGAASWGPTEAIAGMTVAIKGIVSEAKASADGADAASRSLADRKTQLGPLAGTVAQARADKAGIDAQIEDVVGQKSNQEGRATARTELQRMLLENGERQEKLDEQAAAHAAEDIERMMARALAMEQEAQDASTAILAKAPGMHPVHVIAAEQGLRKANSRQASAAFTLGSVEGKTARLRDELTNLEGGDWAKALAMVQRLSECSEVSRILLAICQRNAKPERMAELRSTLAGLHNSHQDAQMETDQATRAVAHAIIDRDIAAREATAYRGRVLDWQAERDSEAERCGRLRREAAEIRETLGKRADRLAELAADRENCDVARIDLERRLNDLDSAGGIVSEVELDAQEQALRDQSAAAEARITALIKASTVDAEMKACGIRAEKAARELDLAKRAMQALKDVRETLMNGMLARLIDPIDVFLAAAGRAETPYVLLENANETPIFEMGWVRGQTRISMDAMSGGERVLWGAALAYALILLANPPLKVLLIEAAGIEGQHARPTAMQVIRGLHSVSSEFDNVLFATCMPLTKEEASGWDVIYTPTESHEQTAPAGQEGG